MAAKSSDLRERLILAGIDEINANGVSRFSVRRVADACHVSCAAPYRHFSNKHDFIAAIIDYVNDQWAARQEEVLAQCGPSPREQIVEICVNYVRFLMEKPIYRSILMLKDDEFDNLYHKKRTQFGSLTQSLEATLQEASGLPGDVWKRKVMICRSLIFGMIFLLDAGDYEYNDVTLEILRFAIDREFDIV